MCPLSKPRTSTGEMYPFWDSYRGIPTTDERGTIDFFSLLVRGGCTGKDLLLPTSVVEDFLAKRIVMVQ